MSNTSLDLLHDLVQKAKKAGADAADAAAIEATSKSVSWHNGKLEDVDGSEGEDIGLRVFIGKRQAMVSTSDRSTESLNKLIDRCMSMAKAVPEDPYCGLAPEDKLHTGPLAELDLYDDTDVSAETLAEIAHRAEDALYSVDGVTNSSGAGASAGSWSMALVTSHGFSNSYKGSSFSASVSGVAGEGTGMERDYDFTSARHFQDMDSPEEFGRRAGEQAVARLNPTKMTSGSLPVVFAPRVANSLLGHFAGAINGTGIARGTSFLKDYLNKQTFSNGISIIDDPKIVRGLKSRLFDGEGVQVQKCALVDDGVLKMWTLNSAAARQLNLPVTGHAGRSTSSPPGIGCSNLYMAAGTVSKDDLIADIKDGVYITELIGMGVNGVTGDYSRGAAGHRIRNGVIAEPVSEITIAGNLKEMFMQCVAASDLKFRYSSNAPTVRIDGMMIAGS
ncbi:modulator protein [Kordiimonas sediminis]|uniref:Modulator protein n=1 Tax=Kordiimonas sediminis TaxID=1735581 RepID=A0A919E7H0_9PROT|nr:TldD/PmbA family protein [Kordiimonas sediminis]GHF20998.1 modulator protein [Kordiimonas sediminis]